VRRLLALQAERARVVRGGAEVEVPVEEVQPGELVLIRPGERVPLDGVIREGSSSLDLSTVTGESAPVYREVDQEVIGGTMNLDGFLRVEVLRPASESYIAQVVRLMRHIEEKKPPIQLLMDRLMNYYGPVVFAVAALAALGWFLHSGEASTAILIGLTTIIMGYPCALGVTTPMVLAIGGGHGIARGLLVRAGEFFQSLSEVDTVAFDKTGTLTYGRPTVREVIAYRGSEDEVLALIAAAEVGSEHPLAGAIVRYAQMQAVRFPEASAFRAIPGKGVHATVGGREVRVGRPGFLADQGVTMVVTGTAVERAAQLEAEGHTVVYAAVDGELIGAVALQDVPRPGTARAIRRLHELGVRSVLLTGDNRPVAEAIARQVGISEVHAELLPGQKVEVIERLQTEGRTVAMVGDGINDAPALVQSDVGIALGAGTDVAMESAGVVLVSDQMQKVVSALVLGRASHRKMKQNIALAVAANVIGMTMAILGLITAPVAIAIMAASILAVLLSTLSLLRLTLEEPEAAEEEESIVETVIPARRMHCDNCARNIDRNLAKAKGVQRVAADATRKEVRVAYRPAETSEDALRHQLEEMGFR
jgi:heavy metal translocating P-type ATPase